MPVAMGALLTAVAPAQTIGTARTIEGKSVTGTLVVTEDGARNITGFPYGPEHNIL